LHDAQRCRSELANGTLARNALVTNVPVGDQPGLAPHPNTFLAALPERERERILAAGQIVPVAAGDVLHESGRVIHEVWFPLDSVASLRASMQDGTEADVAIIGAEGLIGVTPFLGGTDTTSQEAVVQIGGDILRVPVERLRQEVARSTPLRLLLQRYSQALLVQASQTAACNRFHSIEQRLSRCLLALHDRVSRGEIRITHERLAAILGSFRPGVTLAAQHLQDRGIVHYTRGRIEIVDREQLSRVACECYEAVASEYGRLLGPEAIEQLSVVSDIPDETLREVNGRLIVAAIREQQAREAAEEANELAARFFATLSHELRTPLTAILGWSNVLQSRELDDETLALAIDTIHRNAETQKRLVNDMVDLARLRSGKISLRREPVDLPAAVRAAMASCRPSADDSSIAISFISVEPVTAEVDPVRLHQILSNLLSNAVKFTPAGGSIEVALLAGPTDVRISVRDSGRGITAELLPHVFDQFRQGPAAASGELGMGLGLAIVQQLVTLHGGTVHVESRGTGSGTTFTVVLPRTASPG
jgi:signal transduction histidine kinase